jgi:D-xylose 1-dehydrogenase (NADP+, D-xylono-1,5-lactone-forming)
MQKIRWGLLSTANINRRLIPAIRASSRGELAAVASRDQGRAEDYARKWKIPRVFGSYQAMLDSDQVDAVYIGLPNHMHAEWAIRALNSGKHVLGEKPFALSLEEVDSMILASHQTGRILSEAFMYRHHPQTKITGEWVRQGKLGKPVMVRGAFSFELTDPNNVRMIPEFGGGCLWDIGIYPISFSQYIFGSPPQQVSGFQIIGSTGVDEVFAGNMLYPEGGMAQFFASFRVPFNSFIEVIGTEGRLELTRPFLGIETEGKMTFYPAEGKSQRIAVPKVELYSGEIEDMHAAILDGKAPYITLEESRNHVRTALALYRSAGQHQVIQL